MFYPGLEITGNTLFLGIHCKLQVRRLYLKTFKNLTPKTLNSITNYDQTAATQVKVL